MGILSFILALVLVALVIFLWRRFAYQTVDLGDAEERRRSAAQWMAAGEVAAAEEMLRAAIVLLEGWQQAVARGDLASFLIASQREQEAISELELACQATPEDAAAEEEMLELRIRLAHLLVSDGQVEKAEQLLLATKTAGASSLASAMAAEALGEFYVEQGRAPEAIATLGPALALLLSHEHDRAAAAVVSLAYALELAHAESPWQSLATLPQDLKSAAVINFCDRLPAFRAEARSPMLKTLLSSLGDSADFEAERVQLRALAASLAN